MSKNILIVDDSEGVRKLARMALEKAGYQVTEACDGLDATNKLGKTQANLVVCDINMPLMDGMTFARNMKASPSHRFTPLLMLTTASDPATKAAARAIGVSGWLTKPFEPKSLVDAVERLCK